MVSMVTRDPDHPPFPQSGVLIPRPRDQMMKSAGNRGPALSNTKSRPRLGLRRDVLPYPLLPLFFRPALPSPPRSSPFLTLSRHNVPRNGSLQHMTFLHHHQSSDINHPVCSTARLCSLSGIWFVHSSSSTSRHRDSQRRKITPSVFPTKGHRREDRSRSTNHTHISTLEHLFDV